MDDKNLQNLNVYGKYTLLGTENHIRSSIFKIHIKYSFNPTLFSISKMFPHQSRCLKVS
jgi:hypothetical protein